MRTCSRAALGRSSVLLILAACFTASAAAQTKLSYPEFSGVYPHLAFWNDEGECGTGAVVPWAGRLWAITYAPHRPRGSGDKLYSITQDLELSVFPGSVGGTPANRMIHRESNQLLIGPYVIDAAGEVRVIDPDSMYGRLTGTARHLFDPEHKVYYATMEEGLYEVDVETLEVVELFRDEQLAGAERGADSPRSADLPGYHGKGLYSGQGRLIYANNGEHGAEALRRPDLPSGVLAEWDGRSDEWRVVCRSQFTDVRGPGDLFGNAHPETDPVWAIGWDHRSLLLMLLDGGEWSTYRLPKATHTYDGAHGWNTEWPRLRDIGEADLAMNMHGMFWRFPRGFTRKNSAGIAPRSSYLRVVGDYCRFGGRLVLGCDDTAKNEFLNKRRAKGDLVGPGQSNSNLWFIEPAQLDRLGPASGTGAVWLDDPLKANEASDPMLFASFEKRWLYAQHDATDPVQLTLEVDRKGDGEWTPLRSLEVPPGPGTSLPLEADAPGIWLRACFDTDLSSASIVLHLAGPDTRITASDPMFDGLAGAESRDLSAGTVRVRGNGLKTLAFAATQLVDGEPEEPRFYELDAAMNLVHVDDPAALSWTIDHTRVPEGILQLDGNSILYVDDGGDRWRLPIATSELSAPGPLGRNRIAREVATERDLFHAGGTFFELPARNAGGFALVRPISSHDRRIHDYCSYRGLLILTGVDTEAPESNHHIVRSDDGRVALWAGVIDDLWRLGKPRGTGGPWHRTPVRPDVPSDPYLMRGYDRKSLTLTTTSQRPVTVTVRVDATGTGRWIELLNLKVVAHTPTTHDIDSRLQAYWVDLSADIDAEMTATFVYE